MRTAKLQTPVAKQIRVKIKFPTARIFRFPVGSLFGAWNLAFGISVCP